MLLCELFSDNTFKKTKPKYGAMKLKAYEKFISMSELGAIYILGLKGSSGVTQVGLLMVRPCCD